MNTYILHIIIYRFLEFGLEFNTNSCEAYVI